jgi:hypothetical protein
VKVIITHADSQVVIHDPRTNYSADALADWIDQGRRALDGDGEVELLTDTEIAAAADDETEPDGDEDRIGFRGA